MALLDSEINRIRYELGFPVLSNSAEPYIGIAAIFEQVIQPYLLAGASTTSSTSVTAASTPTPVTLTLASATGFSAGARIVVDVDARQEEATVQAVSGSTITVLLSLAHSGTYPVSVEGGESIVRGLLKKLRVVGDQISSSASNAGIKKVDEIEFFGGSESTGSALSQLVKTQGYLRGELWRVLFGGSMQGAGARLAVY